MTAALVGLVLGIMLRGPVFRLAVPAGEPVRTRCCEPGFARWRWLALPYRCRGCRAWLGPVPLVPELLTAAVLGALAARLSGWELLAAAALFTLCVALTLVDLAVHRLPDLLTLPAYGLTLTLLAADGDWPSWRRALLGGLALAGCYLLLHLLAPSGLGFGDVKLALPLGTALAWYGWPTLLQGTTFTVLLAGLYCLALLLLGRATRTTSFALGPFLAAGALLALLLSR
ncbi:A24 family peptidase [Kitasatospora sp. NPDC002227]|uniref:A24 family peptidase n=1 Tax=Kitasatospora sp. NPDC002227 TaxID=3154773 RepID=UPI0033318CC3